MTQQNETNPGFKHPPPRKHVLLLGCMDQRLLDDTASFMNSYNLTNRYDHVVFAGAALGVMRGSSPPVDGGEAERKSAWSDVFFDHMKVAIDELKREIRDVFILEHRDCGAYKILHPTHKKPYCDDPCDQTLEREHHCEQAFLLAQKIRAYCDAQQKQSIKAAAEAKCEADRLEAEKRLEAWTGIKVKCFLMDLEGDVEHLPEPAPEPPKVKKLPKRKTT